MQVSSSTCLSSNRHMASMCLLRRWRICHPKPNELEKTSHYHCQQSNDMLMMDIHRQRYYHHGIGNNIKRYELKNCTYSTRSFHSSRPCPLSLSLSIGGIIRRSHSTAPTPLSLTDEPNNDNDNNDIHTYNNNNNNKHNKNINNKARRPIYVSATREHVGKTTTCLALISGLQKRFPSSIGYIKPVGQRHVPVYSSLQSKEIRVDKDVTLVREHFRLNHVDYCHMSPVLVPSGYTRDYVDGKICAEGQLDRIRGAVAAVSDGCEVVLCEGTGHCAVGSIVGASNAKVAKLVGADMVLVANGGLGSCYDELELNRALCEKHGVTVAGVIINKVRPEKYHQTKDYLSRALGPDLPLIGCIPDRPYLGCPALADLERLLGATLLSGSKHRFRHYTVHDMNLVTTSLPRFLSNLRDKPPRTLYLCHATRDDVVLGFLAEYRRISRRKDKARPPFEAALLICGRKDKYCLSKELRDVILSHDDGDVPVLVCEHTTHRAMEMIHGFTPKLNVNDAGRVNAAVEHYEKYIDFDMLLKRTGNAPRSERTDVVCLD